MCGSVFEAACTHSHFWCWENQLLNWQQPTTDFPQVFPVFMIWILKNSDFLRKQRQQQRAGEMKRMEVRWIKYFCGRRKGILSSFQLQVLLPFQMKSLASRNGKWLWCSSPQSIKWHLFCYSSCPREMTLMCLLSSNNKATNPLPPFDLKSFSCDKSKRKPWNAAINQNDQNGWNIGILH